MYVYVRTGRWVLRFNEDGDGIGNGRTCEVVERDFLRCCHFGDCVCKGTW